jgi:hypothetical protein
MRNAYSLTEGKERARAQARAVVLGANCSGLGSVSGPNPEQFGHQRHRGAARAPTTADSLPSVMQ